MAELHIKNMVCDRCIKAVARIVAEAGLTMQSIQLGKAVVKETPDTNQLGLVAKLLGDEGFELLDDRKAQLVEQIKQLIVDLVHYRDLDEMNENLSSYLAGRLHRDYNHLSHLFSSIENTTVEQFFILQKIERAKELLVYNELTLSQIAFSLGYSSVAHLSGQFKKITGFSPSEFKKLKDHKRKPLDQVLKQE